MANNMFGGRMNHPAYDLRVTLAPNQFLDGITLYTLLSRKGGQDGSFVRYENIDGESGVCGETSEYPIPPWFKKQLHD